MDDDLRKKVKSFRDRLEMMLTEEEINQQQKKSIHYILNNLDDADRNLLILYFEVKDQKYGVSRLAKTLGITSSTLINKIKKIIETIQKCS